MYGQLPTIKTTSGDEVSGYPVSIVNPPKTAVLRLPTADELILFFTTQRVIVTDLGQGKSRSDDMPNPSASSRLFTSLRLDKDGAEFDAAEISKALGLITRHRLISCTREGQEFVVTVGTFLDDVDPDTKDAIPTVHRVRIPYESEVAEYRLHSIIETNLPKNRVEQRFPIGPAIELYDKILLEVQGYVDLSIQGPASIRSLVPPNHKRTVVYAVLDAFSLLDTTSDPNS